MVGGATQGGLGVWGRNNKCLLSLWTSALSHESISDPFPTKCVRGSSRCSTQPKQTWEPGLEKKNKKKTPTSSSHHSGHLLFLSAVLILWPGSVLSLALLSCQPACTCVCARVRPCAPPLSEPLSASLQKNFTKAHLQLARATPPNHPLPLTTLLSAERH